jgi:outer membrane receptor protein involved in Fe transport
VFSGNQLEQANIATLNELQTLTPSLFINTTGGGAADTTIRLRGVGTTGNNAGLEGAVGVFIDGVYRNRSGMALGALDDIQRIEVLRGPQATLFGKNTSAGAISIITNAPGPDYEGALTASYGDPGLHELNGWVNLPVSDTFMTRITAGYAEREGFIENRTTGADNNARERWYVRGQALFDISPDTSLRLIADYTQSNGDCCTAVRVTQGGARSVTVNTIEGLVGSSLTTPGSTDSNSLNFEPDNDSADWGLSAELTWDLSPSVTLTNILAYRDFDGKRSADVDYTGADILNYTILDDQFTTWSEELRLNGESENFLGAQSVNWLAGLFYSEENIDAQARLEFGRDSGKYFCGLFTANTVASCFNETGSQPGAIPTSFVPAGSFNPNHVVAGEGSTTEAQTEATSMSYFAQASLNYTEELTVTLGVRHIQDEKTSSARTFDYNAVAALDGNRLPTFLGLVNDFAVSQEDSFTAGTFNVQYAWTPDFMTYASYTLGYKSGGANLDRTAATTITGQTGAPPLGAPTFRPETSENYEAGLKYVGLDGRARANFAVFDTTFDDLQVLAFTGLQFAVVNASGGYSRGAEMDVAGELWPGMTANLGVTYAYTRYDEGVTIFGTPLGGEHFTNAPVWSGSLGASSNRRSTSTPADPCDRREPPSSAVSA